MQGLKRWAGIAICLALFFCEALRHPLRFADLDDNEETGESGGRHY